MKLIKDVINEKLTGETQKNMLELVTFMQKNGFSFEGFASGNDVRWTATYKGKDIGCVAVAEESMLSAGTSIALWLGLECDFDDNGSVNDELKDFTWSHVVVCPQEKYCKPPYCEGSKNPWEVFGKKYESTCHSPLQFIGLDAENLAKLKELLLASK